MPTVKAIRPPAHHSPKMKNQGKRHVLGESHRCSELHYFHIPPDGPGAVRGKRGKDVIDYICMYLESHNRGQHCHSGVQLQSKPYPAARSSFRLGCHLAYHPETARSIRLTGCLYGQAWVRLTDASSANLDFDGGAVGCWTM